MAEIVRDRTWVFLEDDEKVQWEVVGGRHGPGGKLRRCHPTADDAVVRDFLRYGSYYAGTRQVVERRRYRFAEEESRWFITADWTRQLAAAKSIPTSVGQQPP